MEFYRIIMPGGRIVLVNPKFGFESGLVFKSHANDNGPIEPWLNAHLSEEKEFDIISRAITEEETRLKFMSVARFNRGIVGGKTYHFFSRK